MKCREILTQLRRHAPFTAMGAISGIVLMAILNGMDLPRDVSTNLFWGLHPLHVFVSALVTTAMYRLHSSGGIWRILIVGYLGSIGIATVSDSIIPFVGEWMLQLPNRGVHLGFIEKWWLVNPLAFAGIAVAFVWPKTTFPHAFHMFLSTWASLFHMQMAMEASPDIVQMILVGIFLFLAVWIPCCTSDIVFPLLCVKEESETRR